VLFLRQLYLALAHGLNFVREFSTMGYCVFHSTFYSLLHQVSVGLLTTVATILKNP